MKHTFSWKSVVALGIATFGYVCTKKLTPKQAKDCMIAAIETIESIAVQIVSE